MADQRQKYTVIENGTILTPDKEIRDGVVIIRDQVIIEFGVRGKVEIPPNTRVIDACGNYIAPGMIDIHVNGSMGGDFSKVKPDTFENAGSFFLKHGVSSYLATAITGPDHSFIGILDYVRELQKSKNYKGAEVLGVHMEGPYLSPLQSGAHPRNYLSIPQPSHYKQFLAYSDVLRKMTIAPELDGAIQLVKDLNNSGITVAAGHTNGIYPEMKAAIDAGITHATHSFCNMSTLRRDNLKRVAGAAETLLFEDRVSGELIGDGWHLGETLMNLMVKVKGVEKVCFVTDAMPAAGLPEGKYTIGEVEAIVENGIARLPDNSAYAGSVTTMDNCLKTGVEKMGQTLRNALRMSTLTPAEIIGVDDRKGSIEKGKDADIMILDERLNVCNMIVKGKMLFPEEDL